MKPRSVLFMVFGAFLGSMVTFALCVLSCIPRRKRISEHRQKPDYGTPERYCYRSDSEPEPTDHVRSDNDMEDIY